LSAIIYTIVTWYLYKVELELGTEAIRYLDNSYWADRYLLPSIFYWVGLLEHTPQVLTKYESDPSQADDIPIESFVAQI